MRAGITKLYYGANFGAHTVKRKVNYKRVSIADRYLTGSRISGENWIRKFEFVSGNQISISYDDDSSLSKFGFRSNVSTQDAILYFLESIQHDIVNGIIVLSYLIYRKLLTHYHIKFFLRNSNRRIFRFQRYKSWKVS